MLSYRIKKREGEKRDPFKVELHVDFDLPAGTHSSSSLSSSASLSLFDRSFYLYTCSLFRARCTLISHSLCVAGVTEFETNVASVLQLKDLQKGSFALGTRERDNERGRRTQKEERKKGTIFGRLTSFFHSASRVFSLPHDFIAYLKLNNYSDRYARIPLLTFMSYASFDV